MMGNCLPSAAVTCSDSRRIPPLLAGLSPQPSSKIKGEISATVNSRVGSASLRCGGTSSGHNARERSRIDCVSSGRGWGYLKLMEDEIRPNGLEEMPDVGHVYYHLLCWIHNSLYIKFRPLEASELWPGTKSGISFTTVTIDTAVYLPYLLSKFYSKGGKVVRNRIQHISQVIDGAFSYKDEKPDALVICAGIGARSLGGVEDQDIYPVRGQTILIRAPWITFGRTLSSSDGLWTYIIPRRSGDVGLCVLLDSLYQNFYLFL